MESRWNDLEARACEGDLLKLRVYTSRLLGKDEDLVMHGGGNTSVKIRDTNLFGETDEVLYVKGSGWDLATIEAEGFAPVKMEMLLKMADLESMTDLDMVKYQRMAMTDPGAPNPSVEAILHAIIPFRFVDHTHADAVVTITNTPGGEARIKEIYGDRVLIIPYVMPGFVLARKIYELSKGLDWHSIDGMILLNHGVFTFHDDAKVSYEQMIHLVSLAEKYLDEHAPNELSGPEGKINHLQLAKIRRSVSEGWGQPVLAITDNSPEASAFSQLSKVKEIASRGPITPDHIIRTKQHPVVLGDHPVQDIRTYQKAYQTYFEHHENGEIMLDQAPRWAIQPGTGSVLFGPSVKYTRIIRDIATHTERAIFKAEQLGGWQPLPAEELFEMEYWSLEQAKLKKSTAPKRFQGKVALVTGAASGIGKACVEMLVAAGAAVGALDINPEVKNLFSAEVLPLVGDVTDSKEIDQVLKTLIGQLGGLDMLVSNAGIFPMSAKIAEMPADTWRQSLEINLTSHQRMIQYCTPFLELGFDPSVVIIGSKNVPAPGPGAAAYSVAKAGLTQLSRVAALELGSMGIRVNVVHPNAVYDTAIWSDDVLKARANHYGLTVEEYKTNNILKSEVTSKDVALLVREMLGQAFAKTTGAQVPIDGGNERVI